MWPAHSIRCFVQNTRTKTASSIWSIARRVSSGMRSNAACSVGWLRATLGWQSSSSIFSFLWTLLTDGVCLR